MTLRMPLLVLVPELELEEAPELDGDVYDDVAMVEVEALVQDDDVHDDVVLAVEALVPACD